jgi:hypothetical protein
MHPSIRSIDSPTSFIMSYPIRHLLRSAPSPSSQTRSAHTRLCRAELKVLLGEVNDAIVDLDKQCCFSPKPDLEDVKSTLISKGWLSEVNTILAKHGLVADLNAFWIYNGQSASQHMAMRIYNLNAATAASTAAQAATIAPVIQSNNMNDGIL